MKYIYRIFYYDKYYDCNSVDVYMNKEDLLKVKPFIADYKTLPILDNFDSNYYYINKEGKIVPMLEEYFFGRPHYKYTMIDDRRWLLKQVVYNPVRVAKILNAIANATPLKGE